MRTTNHVFASDFATGRRGHRFRLRPSLALSVALSVAIVASGGLGAAAVDQQCLADCVDPCSDVCSDQSQIQRQACLRECQQSNALCNEACQTPSHPDPGPEPGPGPGPTPNPEVSPLQFGSIDGKLRGFVDLHTHPMSYLGFGEKAVHGAPGFGSVIPPGMLACGPQSRVSSIDEALGSCNTTHGGWGAFDNPCGDTIRAAIINYALDDEFESKFPLGQYLHGEHEHAGYPEFNFWPHHTSILHQQMWWEWIQRAYEGGLRIMVALTVNSELLAEILNGTSPHDDKFVADRQIDEMINFVDDPRNGGFMRIVRSAAELRETVSQNKLAVVLGMEVDKLGNFGKPGVPTDEASVRAEIDRLYNKGIRYVFPIHLVDNSFGGSAVYDLLFSFSNKYSNGYHFLVTPSDDPKVTYTAQMTDGPLGFENSLILGLRGFLDGLGELPAPCASFSCFPPRIRCCGSYQSVLDNVSPSPELDIYKLIPGGHVNALGLTSLGEVAIDQLMRLGMLIDVDHMSERSMRGALELAKKSDYPLVMGHNSVRGENSSERHAPEELVERLSKLGGMFGVGTAHATPAEFIANYQRARSAMGPDAGVGMGTDVDGFEQLPKHTMPATQEASDAFYERFRSGSGMSSKGRTGTHDWDYVLEGGVSHYGLMPEFLFDVRTSPGGSEVVEGLVQSAEGFAELWEKAEHTAPNVGALPVETPNCEPDTAVCGGSCRPLTVHIDSGFGQCHSDCDCGARSDYYCVRGPDQCLSTTVMQPRAGYLEQAIGFTGTSNSTGSEGAFVPVIGSDAQVALGTSRDVTFHFGFSYDYPSGPSTMGLDVRFLLDGREVARTRAISRSFPFDFLVQNASSGTLTIEVRGVLLNGPPTTVTFKTDWSSLSGTVVRQLE